MADVSDAVFIFQKDAGYAAIDAEMRQLIATSGVGAGLANGSPIPHGLKYRPGA